MQDFFSKRPVIFFLLLIIAANSIAQKNDLLTEKIAYPELPFTFRLPDYFKTMIPPFSRPNNVHFKSIHAKTTKGGIFSNLAIETVNETMLLDNYYKDSITGMIRASIFRSSVWDCDSSKPLLITNKYAGNKVPFYWATAIGKKKEKTSNADVPIALATGIFKVGEYRIRIRFSFETNNAEKDLQLAEEIAKSIHFSEMLTLNRIGMGKLYQFRPTQFLHSAFSFCKGDAWVAIDSIFADDYKVKYQLDKINTLEIQQRSKTKTQAVDEYANDTKVAIQNAADFKEAAFLQIEKKKNAQGIAYFNLPFTAKQKDNKISGNEYVLLLNDTTVVHVRAINKPSPIDFLKEKGIDNTKLITGIIDNIDNTGTRSEISKDKFNFLIPSGWRIDERSSEELIGLLPLKGTEKEPVLIVKRIPKSNYKIQATVDGIIKDLKSDADNEVTITQDTIQSTLGEVWLVKATISSMGSKTFDTYAVFEKGKSIVIVKVVSGRFSQREHFSAFEKMVATILQYNP